MARTRRLTLALAALALVLAAPGRAAALESPPAPQPPDVQPPSMTKLTLSPSSARAADGATMRFTLSEAARVDGVVERRSPGVRTKGKRCVQRTRKRHGPICILRSRAGTFLASRAAVGENQARLGLSRLRPGNYTLTVTPTDAAGNAGRPAAVQFSVVAR